MLTSKRKRSVNMLHFAIEERGNLTGKISKNAIESNSFNLKDMIEMQNLFEYYNYDEEEKMDVYYLENDKLFLVLQEVKRMIEHERKLYKKHELDFADYFDFMYECETKRFWEFLIQVALNAKFDWEKYTVTVKIEVVKEIDLDNIEI